MGAATGRFSSVLGRIHSTAAILAAALVVRLLWAFAVPVSPISDSHVYDLLARSLARGIGYCWSEGQPTAYWPVGTSFAYSLLYRVFGESYLPIVALNILISLATIWLLIRLTARWFNPGVAARAGWIFVFWPVQIEFTTVLASELLFNFLMLLMLELWETESLNPWLGAGLAGLAAAGAAYVRPMAILFPALLFLISAARDRKFWRPAARGVLAAFILMLAIAPWSVRNTRIFGRFQLISTNGGPNFWMGNNPNSEGEYEHLPADAEAMPEGARDAYLSHQASAYIRAYPWRFVLRTVRKAIRLHDHETIGVHWNLDALQARYGSRTVWSLKLVSDLYWLIVLALAIPGLVILLRRVGSWRFCSAPATVLWGYFVVLYAVTVTQDRYHFPCLPSIAIFAALAIDTMRRRAIASRILG